MLRWGRCALMTLSYGLVLSVLQRALNTATNEFLLTKAEEMVTIDTDIVYLPQHLQWLWNMMNQ